MQATTLNGMLNNFQMFFIPNKAEVKKEVPKEEVTNKAQEQFNVTDSEVRDQLLQRIENYKHDLNAAKATIQTLANENSMLSNEWEVEKSLLQSKIKNLEEERAALQSKVTGLEVAMELHHRPVVEELDGLNPDDLEYAVDAMINVKVKGGTEEPHKFKAAPRDPEFLREKRRT